MVTVHVGVLLLGAVGFLMLGASVAMFAVDNADYGRFSKQAVEMLLLGLGVVATAVVLVLLFPI